MKFILILPEICASTICPLSSSTRNFAFGNASLITPSTSMRSSLLIVILLESEVPLWSRPHNAQNALKAFRRPLQRSSHLPKSLSARFPDSPSVRWRIPCLPGAPDRYGPGRSWGSRDLHANSCRSHDPRTPERSKSDFSPRATEWRARYHSNGARFGPVQYP